MGLASTLIGILLGTMAGLGSAPAASLVLEHEADSLVGAESTVSARAEDTLLDIARRHGLGYEEIRRANPDLDVWAPGAGARVVLPTVHLLPDVPRRGIVINRAELRLYYFPAPRPGQPRRVVTYPISVGRAGWETPGGLTEVVGKALDPAWYPPASIRAERAARGEPLPRRVPPGPDNPLGRHSLRLGLPGYLLHGTNRPAGIGMRVTHGCIRLYPEDVAALYAEVPVGTAVRIIDAPIKAGWHRGVLYLEVHPLFDDAGSGAAPSLTGAVRQIVAVTPSARMGLLDWASVRSTLQARRGTPAPVSYAASYSVASRP